MIAMNFSKQQALDADPKAIQQINFTGNLNRGEDVNYFRLCENCESIVILFCFNIISK